MADSIELLYSDEEDLFEARSLPALTVEEVYPTDENSKNGDGDDDDNDGRARDDNNVGYDDNDGRDDNYAGYGDNDGNDGSDDNDGSDIDDNDGHDNDGNDDNDSHDNDGHDDNNGCNDGGNSGAGSDEVLVQLKTMNKLLGKLQKRQKATEKYVKSLEDKLEKKGKRSPSSKRCKASAEVKVAKLVM